MGFGRALGGFCVCVTRNMHRVISVLRNAVNVIGLKGGVGIEIFFGLFQCFINNKIK